MVYRNNECQYPGIGLGWPLGAAGCCCGLRAADSSWGLEAGSLASCAASICYSRGACGAVTTEPPSYVGSMPKYPDPPGFSEWEEQVPRVLRRSPIWRTPASRFSVWLADLAKEDVAPLWRNPETRSIADQLSRSANAISATLAEGYGRTTGPERARYYDFAASSAREACDGYFKARHSLPESVVEARLELLDRIIRILSVAIPRERADRIGRARRTRLSRARLDQASESVER